MPKGVIITTGDCSDYDGFTCLPLYKKAAAAKGLDVVFVMNYPAFFQFESNENAVAAFNIDWDELKIHNNDSTVAAKAAAQAAAAHFRSAEQRVHLFGR
jgi:hypothetical protein